MPLIEERADGETLSVNAAKDGVLQVTDAFADLAAWTARIDGKQVELRPYGEAFGEVSIPAGPHVVALAYEPRGLRTSLVVSAVALLGVFLAVLLPLRPSSR